MIIDIKKHVHRKEKTIINVVEIQTRDLQVINLLVPIIQVEVFFHQEEVLQGEILLQEDLHRVQVVEEVLHAGSHSNKFCTLIDQGCYAITLNGYYQ